MNRVLGVTGASGYIGRAVIQRAEAQGWKIIAIGRHPIGGSASWRKADLQERPASNLLDDIDAVLHLAADTVGGQIHPQSEIAFAHDLATQAARKGIPFVFTSSQTAAVDAASQYGLTKHAIEQAISPLGAISIRPGMVIGGSTDGLFGLLVLLVRLLPAIPKLLPRPTVQPVHVDDLADALLEACKHQELGGRVIEIAGAPIYFDELLNGIARHRLWVRRLSIPVPVLLLRGILRLLALVPGSRLSPARLDSLLSLPALDAQEDFLVLGTKLKPLAQALQCPRRRYRPLLMEGWMLAKALTGITPAKGLVRRYARFLRSVDLEALPLPLTLLYRPTWIAALDVPARKMGNEELGNFSWRLSLISRLAESRVEWASLFLMSRSQAGICIVLLNLTCSAARELHMRIIAPIALRLGKPFL